jgi:hypothetical protein
MADDRGWFRFHQRQQAVQTKAVEAERTTMHREREGETR